MFWQYASAWSMSVPPPSWMPNSTSTGSSSSSVRSTIEVSKAITFVSSVGSEASDAPSTPAWTTELAMLPLWSSARINSAASERFLRACPTSRSGMTVLCSGR